MSQFPKNVVVAFQESIEEFDSDNIVAKNTDVRPSDGLKNFRTNQREWVPQAMISQTVDGIDITSELGRSITELSVPFDINIIPNVPFTLDSFELNDASIVRKKISSGVQALSARLNREVVKVILNSAGQTVVQSGALSTYNDIAAAESALTRQDVSLTSLKTLTLNIQDYNTVAGDLAKRDDMGNKVLSAYERSLVGNVANFDTFKTSFMPTLTAALGTATVNGAQSSVPVASTDDADGNPTNVDNRFFNLVVSSTTDMKAGDRFTAGVKEVSLINKALTGELRTFTIRQVVSGTTIEISPAPVAFDQASLEEQEYANVDTQLANSAPLVFINTVDRPINAFWENDSIAINSGKLAVNDLDGISVMTETTDSGVMIVIASDGVLGNFTNQYRMTMFFGITNKDPMKNGIILPNQT